MTKTARIHTTPMICALIAVLGAMILLSQSGEGFAQDTQGDAQENAPIQDKENYDPAQAICGIDNRGCVLKNLRATAKQIEKDEWRDQTLRELAKSYAADGYLDVAISIINDIKTPDTQAMTIRGIGMEIAKLSLPDTQRDAAFVKLRAAAEKIGHPPSYAIALTYIAMGQAFAGDDAGAWKTAGEMENEALRHKAYGETAEIQAEKGNDSAAMHSIGLIKDEAYRNKAYGTISKILADRGLLDQSYKAALAIKNPYLKSQSLQYMLDKQKQMRAQDAEKTGKIGETAP